MKHAQEIVNGGEVFFLSTLFVVFNSVGMIVHLGWLASWSKGMVNMVGIEGIGTLKP